MVANRPKTGPLGTVDIWSTWLAEGLSAAFTRCLHAEELQPDGSGRLLIPAPLREFAKLEKHVVLVGQGNKFELWDEQTWYRLREQWLAEDGGEAGALPDDLESLSF
mgnify:CR=1 FL=1